MNIYFQKSFQRGFGTYPLKGDELRRAIEAAIDVGYRAFDTAQMYGNEADTGEALAECGVPRSELCITTKVHPDNYTDETFLPSVETSLRALKTDCVDVLLLHWPPANGEIAPSLRMLRSALERGLTRSVGVSNYTAAMMREARSIVDVPLVTNQVEFHPLLNQEKLLAAAAETGIPITSYASIARGEIFKHGLFPRSARPTASPRHRWRCAGLSRKAFRSIPCPPSRQTSARTSRSWISLSRQSTCKGSTR